LTFVSYSRTIHLRERVLIGIPSALGPIRRQDAGDATITPASVSCRDPHQRAVLW
jgi:hypothetical protein